MTEPSLPELEAERDRLYAQLSTAGDFRRGSVSENYRKCGKPNCACAAADHPGPRAAVLVDQVSREPQDRRPAAGGGGGGEGAPRDRPVRGVHGGRRADRRGERADLRGPAGGRNAGAPGAGGRKRGLFAALAEAKSAEIARLAAEAARALGCDGGLGAAETVLRAGLLKLGGSMLGQLLSADPGQRGPRVPCGQGHEAEFTDYRDKTFDTVLGPVTLRRAWYSCAECKHGSRRAIPSSAWPARPCPRAWPR